MFESAFLKKIRTIGLFIIALFLISSNKAFADTTLSTVEYSTPTFNGRPYDITIGDDNNMWFTEIFGNKIGKIDNNGIVNEYFVPGELFQITKGINKLWFIQRGSIGKIDYQGEVVVYPLADSNLLPSGIALGNDANIWFTLYSNNKIAKITENGTITEYTVSSDLDTPLGLGDLTKGSDGNMWFLEFNAIGKIATNGVITHYSLPDNSGAPTHLVLGPDNNIWFTQQGQSKIGRITPNGVITLYTVSTGDNDLGDIIVGKDGNIWFFEKGKNKLGKITTGGTITHFDISSTSSGIMNMAVGVDGDIWYTDSLKDKIYRIKFDAQSPSPIPATLIKDFKQTDPQWANSRLSNATNCGTMYSFGCAVTSVANVFYSYGKTLLPNNESLDPGTLNNWLANIQGGFVSCAINWGKASTAFNYGAPNIIFRNGNSTWSNGINTIDTALARGDLVILGLEPRANATHFLVVDKKLPDVNGNPDYRLVDPALYPFIANNPGNTGKSFSQVYGSFDKVYEAVIYKKNSQSNKSLTVRAHSPVQLRITDPEGNVTGYNVDSQQIEENIFQSSYGIEYGIAPVDGSLPSSEETKYFQQIDPLEGEYKIEVIGTGNGSYTLDVTNTDENANSSTQILQGYAQSGITEVYNFEYTSDASEAPVIIKEITFDTLHLDIKKLYQQKQIKNVIFYTALKVQAEVAERATLINRQPLGNKLAIITLKAMLVELNKQKGKSITVEGYNLLYTDITSLINQLQGDQNGGSGSGGSNGGS